MARRRTSAFEDLIVVLSRLPWWASLAIGLVSWLILHPIATAPVTPPAALKPGDMGGILTAQRWRTVALFGQYLIPIACGLGAVGSVIARYKRKQLLGSVTAATQPGKAIDGLSWQQFEHLIGEAFRRKGYSITETGGQGADGGVDLILRKNNEKYLVQCKHWRSLKVGVPVVREFFGAMAAESAAGGYVVTSGQFTQEAKSFAQGRNIQLIDGAGLKRLMLRAQPSTAITQPTSTSSSAATAAALQPSIDPTCPLCHSMIKRTARKGTNAGNSFWGCSTYPKCRGIVNVQPP
ncbi:restriction endonuclease [Halopseudomonas pachastrellae]|uniref:restriction endonuclease n=1 Tax=Halopseudomonas pachastrellae TaxID=254161 RepID=UPI003D7EBDD4